MTQHLTSFGQHGSPGLVPRPESADDERTRSEDHRPTPDEPRLELLVPDGTVATETGAEQRVSIALVDPDPTIRAVLADHLRSLEVIAFTYEELSELLDGPDCALPTIVVIGPSEPPETLVPQVEAFLRKRPLCGAVLLLFDLAPEVVQQAFRAGIDDVVAVDAHDRELLSAITRAEDRLQKRVEEVEQAALVASMVRAAPVPVTPEGGRILTVFGTKGGVGKSVVATNLAATLAQQVDGVVALVDLNLQFGDAAILLQLQPAHTIADAAIAAERLDADLLRDLLLRHHGTGVHVLAAPTDPGAADQIQRTDVVHILTVLREMCAFVLVDTSPHLSDTALAALELADDIILVATPDVMSLKNSRVSLQALQVLGIPFSKIKFVLNRTNHAGPLAPGDAERVLQMKADALLPEVGAVAESVNLGMPLSITAPASKFTEALAGLARQLAVPANVTKRHPRPQGSRDAHDPLPDRREVVASPVLGQPAAPLQEPRRHWRRSKDRSKDMDNDKNKKGTKEAEVASI